MAKRKAHRYSPSGLVAPDVIKETKEMTPKCMTDKDNGYYIMTNVLLSYLKPTEHKIACYVEQYSSRLGSMKISQKRLSEITQISENSIPGYLDDLEDIGIIQYTFSESPRVRCYAINVENVDRLKKICSDAKLSDKGIVQLRNHFGYKNIGSWKDTEIKNVIKKCETDEEKLDFQE